MRDLTPGGIIKRFRGGKTGRGGVVKREIAGSSPSSGLD